MKQLYIDIFEGVKGVKAFFSTKHGASNGSPYYHEEALAQLGLKGLTLAQPQQIHEAKIGVIGAEECRILDEAGEVIQAWSRHEAGPEIEAWVQGGAVVQESGPQEYEHIRFPGTDGVITNQKDILLTTVHADCLPVWLYDEENQAIGLVHAGWRGTLAGIGPKAVKLMHETYGSDPAKLKAAIGPGISQCCFETGPEVIEAFRGQWAFADRFAETAKAHFPEGKMPESAIGKYYIDLKGINLEELVQAGLSRENVQISEHCTHCEPETFASYRREGGTYMRMGAGICLK